ncbi:MAG TPA: hypothetical protein VKJ01_11330, partial [Candidatus Solibacter sp.]|nr:hypothetical protein [Candidatus Solibacter sp.]
KDDDTPVVLPNLLGAVPPRDVVTASLSPVPTLGELGADLSLSAIPATEPSPVESGELAAGLQANQMAGPVGAMPGDSGPRPQSVGVPAATQPAECAPEATEEETPTGRTAPGTDAPAEDAQPDWTRLLDSAVAAAPIVSSPLANSPASAQVYAPPQRAGFHPATARQKVTASSEAQAAELAARDPNPLAGVSGANVPPEAQASPLPRLESDSPVPGRQPAANRALAASLLDPLVLAASSSTNSMNPGERPNLAFEAHLIPMTMSEALAKAGAPDRPLSMAADSFGQSALPAAAPSAGTATDHHQDNGPSGGQERKDTAAERFRKTDAPQTAAGEVPLTAGEAGAHLPVAPEPQADRISGQTAGSPGSNPLSPKETVEPPSAPEPPKAPAAARDIRLEVNAGDQRVEVRLVERGGEVHVAVRTPDTQLAETLRADLPALSSRLTESGFRTETWRPGASGGAEWHRQTEPSAGGSPQDSSSQPRQNGREQQPGEQPPARPKVPEEQLHRKEKGKDFEWLISTLR